MRQRRCARRSPEVPNKEPEGRSEPEHAWKALSLVNDWLRHAEAKLGVTLTATGVTGGVLFSLVRNHGDQHCIFNIASVMCCLAVLAAGICAMVGLFPVLSLGGRRDPEEVINPLFFHHIARAYRNDAPTYQNVLHTHGEPGRPD